MTESLYSINDLLTLMARLREPDYGCPWDLAQSYKTIVPSTLEEAYEVVDAIEQNNPVQLKEELGDLLFQIVFYSHLAKEDEKFDFHEVVSSLTGKLIRRHPHVFPDGTLDSRSDLTVADNSSDNDEQTEVQEKIKKTWEKIKSEERQTKGHNSVMDDVPLALPSVVRAVKLQKRAASVNFDWSEIQDVYEKIQEEIVELQEASAERQIESQNTVKQNTVKQNTAKQDPVSPSKDAVEEELGDLLFTVINLSRHLKVDPETALRRANSKFESRFRYVETLAIQESKALATSSVDELEALWARAKRQHAND